MVIEVPALAPSLKATALDEAEEHELEVRILGQRIPKQLATNLALNSHGTLAPLPPSRVLPPHRNRCSSIQESRTPQSHHDQVLDPRRGTHPIAEFPDCADDGSPPGMLMPLILSEPGAVSPLPAIEACARRTCSNGECGEVFSRSTNTRGAACCDQDWPDTAASAMSKPVFIFMIEPSSCFKPLRRRCIKHAQAYSRAGRLLMTVNESIQPRPYEQTQAISHYMPPEIQPIRR